VFLEKHSQGTLGVKYYAKVLITEDDIIDRIMKTEDENSKCQLMNE
jgi:hypothetical protein